MGSYVVAHLRSWGGCVAVRESRAVIGDHPERQWDSSSTRRIGLMRELV